MKKETIRVTAGDWGGDYDVPTGRDAIQTFFAEIAIGKIKLCQLSPIGMCNDGTGDIPFRIAPTLFRLGMISMEDLHATLAQCVEGFTDADLRYMIEQDAWMSEDIT